MQTEGVMSEKEVQYFEKVKDVSKNGTLHEEKD